MRKAALITMTLMAMLGFLIPAHAEAPAGGSGVDLGFWSRLMDGQEDAEGIRGNVTLDEGRISARPAGEDDLVVRFPMDNTTGAPRSVTYKVEVRDLSGKRIARGKGRFTTPQGKDTFAIRLRDIPALDDAGSDADYVVRWSFETDRSRYSGRRSLYQMASEGRVALAAIWPETLHAGAPVLLPLSLADARGRPLAGQSVTVRAAAEGRSWETTVRTGATGSALAALPPLPEGKVTLRAETRRDGWTSAMDREVQVVAKTRIFLSSDKPLYQPGQTVHLRGILLRRPAMLPLADEDALVEIRDAKGNKVFKEVLRTNGFGVLSTEFTLATQVNMGTYTLELVAGDNRAEKAFTVSRYVLPKFKVGVELDRGFYLPAQEIKGTIRADYFFGKPVERGAVRVTFHDYQGQWVPSKVIEGEANDEGLFSFEHTLPGTLVGQPVEGGNALVLLEVEVTDGAGQVQTANRQITVARQAMDVTLIPESGALVAGVENRFFVAMTDPGGNPVAGKVSVQFGGIADATREVDVGPSGLATVTWTPPAGLPSVQAVLTATSADGRVERHMDLQATYSGAQVLVRTGSTLLKVGDTLDIEILTAGAVTDAYLDVTRDGQTVAVASVPLPGGVGRHSLELDPSMTGTLAISAYVLSERGEYTRDARVVYVEDPGALALDVRLDKDSYRPAETARVDVTVTDEAGRPVRAALGVQVVDEAVFALQDARPGLLKLFFALEEELLKPSYQIGRGIGATLGQLIGSAAAADTASRTALQDDAEAAVAAQGDVALPRQAASTRGEERARVVEAMTRYGLTAQNQVAAKIQQGDTCKYWNSGRRPQALMEAVQNALKRDAWGTRPKLEDLGDQIQVASAGPDTRHGTWDDAGFTIGYWQICPQPVVETAARFRNGGMQERMFNEVPMAVAGAARGAGDDLIADGLAMPMKKPADKGGETTRDSEDDADGGAAPAPRVRQWFPETLFVEDCLITDDQGRASLDIPLADSITTWRMSAVGSDAQGRIGGADTPITVFQDFFVDVDFPVFLTRGDEVTFPVAVYNYLDEDQTVTITVEAAPWFELLGDGEVVLDLGPGEVSGLSIPVRVKDAGWHALLVTGQGSKGLADAVRRTVEVRPDGREVTVATGGTFNTEKKRDAATMELTFPADTVPGSRRAMVQILPGLTSHVVQGMDSLLKLPGGCFEQTSSSAWPNVLALKYLKDTEQGTPELEMKAMQYVNAGYQRILTFECPSGGFNWWQGDPIGNVILSAFGMMMLRDTQAVYGAVDDLVIDRAFRFLTSRQQSDGSWGEDRHLHAGNENLGAGQLRSTCYISWALGASGYADTPAGKKATAFIQGKVGDEEDLYTLGICVNALATAGAGGAAMDDAIHRIAGKATTDGDRIHWEPQGMTLVNSGGIAAQVEVTALMALAYMGARRNLSDVPKIVNWLAASKDAQGNWGYNTQATVMALKVFVAAARLDPGATDAQVRVLLDGEELGAKGFDDFNKDVLWQVEIPGEALDHARSLRLEFAGVGNLGYQVVTGHHVPWTETADGKPPLSIDVSYDRKKLQVDETVRVRAKVTRNDEGAKGSVLVTLGVPPGFDLVTEDLEGLKVERKIRSWEKTGRQLILYLDEAPVGKVIHLEYRIKARMPVKAASGGAEVRLYYNPSVRDREGPTALEVH
ncbi:MAG: MG2 domain-containing protein [Pseudomonadota bacterium]